VICILLNADTFLQMFQGLTYKVVKIHKIIVLVYIGVYMCARPVCDRECYLLLVLDSVTSTPQWIRQPEPRDVHHPCVCVFECKCVL
jgi:hypothetical protein